MNAIIENEMRQTPNGNFYTLKKLGAIGGLLLGLILLITGSVLSIITFVEHVNFDNAELILISTSFVFLGIGSHCLDLFEKEKKAKKR